MTGIADPGAGTSGGTSPVRPPEPALVRPYILTGGRTTSIGVDLAIEALVVRSDRPTSVVRSVEERWILSLCAAPAAIAELAARTGLPLGVTRVLVSDLAAHGEVEVCSTAERGDATLLRRLREGVGDL